ncbi:MAG: MliC family protein [Alistipes senegalensis]|nr:MliC family protein [Oxalobacter formigenes]MCM1281178.1 MliC family protein [Alistipes senegalensis]
MKRLPFVTLILLLAACSQTASRKTPSPDSPTNRVRYVCDSGRPIDITYRNNGILLRYREKNHHLKTAISASGARYAGNGLVWWNKGTENRLYKLVGTEGTGDLMENCREISDNTK